MTILFFGSEVGFKKFEYDNILVSGFKYRLCTRIDQCRGVEFQGYVVHYTATKELRRQVSQIIEELDYRAKKFKNGPQQHP